MTGKSPDIIAYPNGNETPAKLWKPQGALACFLVLAYILAATSFRLQPGSQGAMTLKRFTLTGDCAIEAQCRVSRSLFSLYRVSRSLEKKRRFAIFHPCRRPDSLTSRNFDRECQTDAIAAVR